MRAIQLTAPGTLELVDVPTPEPGPGEILLATAAVGACHSDLHILDAPAGVFPTPMTIGHEIAGRVAQLGPGVTGWAEGDTAAVYGIIGCGRCRACLRGLENQCRTVTVGGVGISRDGGLADHVVVPADRLLPLHGLDPVQAAPLTDAGLTPYHAISLSRDALRPGTHAVVIGVGGLGHMAVQILAVTTAVTIIAVDTSDAALRLAKRMGAHHTVQAGPAAVDQIRELTGPAPDGADVVLDFVCVDATLDTARQVVSTGGHLTMVGLGGGTLRIAATVEGPPPVPMETSAVIPFWGTLAELSEVIALGRQGLLRAEVQTFPLAEAVQAYQQLRDGKIHGRAVLVP
ncbi:MULTISPECIES: NAD(P)-dependent alcohol dehydrogenase [unclassified Solwaraspora]|uniref:NAD(P)-dependent alcohol dehydrogenase n=1 Tax=unclassified Solwaraspora TaxID=2627926 RepID=UPI00248AE3FC|nr:MULTISPECIES: NAD(P)-dependent alcohol dehydrogenase [unclassified Solwaraspora]WBB95579.1 NAD(P)-dependent alcohol dehydrogenase [Solwaraspora sp. WMMA2059]WBC20516.1 NAD(P)-dependent alcohol dehydrogenase [Solwaraspora sp. WMMA2080]WJK37348.1 NAD(P)-dependent alcohol dehydrogenase [Solwaraspora sp. WMMA2065]